MNRRIVLPGGARLLAGAAREERKGMFHGAGCHLPVYSSRAKYDPVTGWPNFRDSEPGAAGTRPDRSLFVTCAGCHCCRCGGHFGHILGDGPRPTGMRCCIDGPAPGFEPAAA